MEEVSAKLIFSQRLAGYLMYRGFVLKDMRRNTDGSGKNVFYFKYTPELYNAIDDYMTDLLIQSGHLSWELVRKI